LHQGTRRTHARPAGDDPSTAGRFLSAAPPSAGDAGRHAVWHLAAGGSVELAVELHARGRSHTLATKGLTVADEPREHLVELTLEAAALQDAIRLLSR
jgi:hypothetical protein